jgi:restriction endonuclease S subunit
VKYKPFRIGELFSAVRGKSVYKKEYIRDHEGEYPVYSAALTEPLGFIDTYDYEGSFLSWTANGYAGHVKIIEGKFSINADRGLLVPREEGLLCLDYCRVVMQPELRGQAVGRIVEGKKNEYTKLSEKTVLETTILVPVNGKGVPDKATQQKAVEKNKKIELLQEILSDHLHTLSSSSVVLERDFKVAQLALSETDWFDLEIGTRVLKKDVLPKGLPVYSANVSKPFGYIKKSNIKSFLTPSLLWGIDGIFDWGYVAAGEKFATTDHCGRLVIKSPDLFPKYIYYALKSTANQYGFDRTYRASLSNIKDVVKVQVPVKRNGKYDVDLQKKIAAQYERIEKVKCAAMAGLQKLITAQVVMDLP